MKSSPWPMAATFFRILVVPALVALILLKPPHWGLWSGWLFILASLTDWLDGYLARKLNSVSVMGKFLDPVADKVLVSGTLIMLLPMKSIEALAVLLLISRDMIVGGLRSIAASQGQVIPAGPWGKWKTACQMGAIPCLFFHESWSFLPFDLMGYYGLWISVALSLISGGQYMLDFYKTSPRL